MSGKITLAEMTTANDRESHSANDRGDDSAMSGVVTPVMAWMITLPVTGMPHCQC